MITSALDFIHARKWIVELLVIVAIAGAVWWFCSHLIGVGVQRQKDDDAKVLAEWQHTADLEAGRKQGLADAANKARDEEIKGLRDYRDTHPLHGGLCLKPSAAAAVPAAAGTISGYGSSITSPGDLLSLPEGGTGSGGQPEADVRHLLDVLAGRADLLSATLREYQAR